MLVHLSIRNFAIVKQLDVELSAGMTAITGETGAGKSIAIDALSLCLGERAEATAVRVGAQKAEITATFSIYGNPKANKWLAENELSADDETCILRRVISAEGRSRAFINGSPVPLQQLKEMGALLVTIHGQHAHQALLKPEHQRSLLDSDSNVQKDLTKVKEAAKAHKQVQTELTQLLSLKQQREDRKNLLAYQLSELDEFALAEGEFEDLETQFKKLSHGQSLIEESQMSYHYLCDAEQSNVTNIMQSALDRLQSIVAHDAQLQPIVTMLTEAQINIDEAATELREYIESLEMDPVKMQQVEQRYTKAIELARKHNTMPEHLPKHHAELIEEFKLLTGDDVKSDTLKEQLSELEIQYHQAADKLHAQRSKRAKSLAKQVTTEINKMNMNEAVFTIEVSPENKDKINSKGHDNVRFLLCSNKGMHADKLEKAASGGELSRIGLALQVLGNQSLSVPTLIFDEVDTGISGGTASVVGELLRQLGDKQSAKQHESQVFCVTHLPQVAAKAKQQMLVTKFSDGKTTETQMMPLDNDKRIEEVARLLAGDAITDSAIANARVLLATD